MPVYLRKERPTVSKWAPPPHARARDGVAYADPEAIQEVKRWRWSWGDRPNTKTRYVMLPDGEQYVVWLPEFLTE